MHFVKLAPAIAVVILDRACVNGRFRLQPQERLSYFADARCR